MGRDDVSQKNGGKAQETRSTYFENNTLHVWLNRFGDPLICGKILSAGKIPWTRSLGKKKKK